MPLCKKEGHHDQQRYIHDANIALKKESAFAGPNFYWLYQHKRNIVDKGMQDNEGQTLCETILKWLNINDAAIVMIVSITSANHSGRSA